MLRMEKHPAVGGDTAWVSQYGLYDSLSPHLQAFLDGLHAVHTSRLQCKRPLPLLHLFPDSSQSQKMIQSSTLGELLRIGHRLTRITPPCVHTPSQGWKLWMWTLVSWRGSRNSRRKKAMHCWGSWDTTFILRMIILWGGNGKLEV